jgi:hypothetical protein
MVNERIAEGKALERMYEWEDQGRIKRGTDSWDLLFTRYKNVFLSQENRRSKGEKVFDDEFDDFPDVNHYLVKKGLL